MSCTLNDLLSDAYDIQKKVSDLMDDVKNLKDAEILNSLFWIYEDLMVLRVNIAMLQKKGEKK